MSNRGNAFKFINQADNVWNGCTVQGVELSVNANFTGNVTITGIVDSAGVPVSWTLTSPTAGRYAAPGAAASGGSLISYAMTNASDSGKATLVFFPQ